VKHETESKAGLPVLGFPSAAHWERWLAAQPLTSKGVWLKLAKKNSGAPSVSRQEAINGALCHGWIDGQLQKYDAAYWLVRFTPRGPKSRWSAVNCRRIEALMAEGRVSTAGLEAVAQAKSDGRWEAAYPAQSKAAVPADLQHALAANPAAADAFKQLDSANRYAILYRVHHATKPEARAAKIAQFVDMLAHGGTLHPRKERKL